LTRARLIELGHRFELDVNSRSSKDELIDALARSKRASYEAILGELSRDELKEICRAHELSDAGKAKAGIIDRILGREEGDSSPAEPEPARRKRGKKKAARAVAAVGPSAAAGGGTGQWWALGMLVGWLLVGGAGYWLLTMEEDAAAQMRTQAAAKSAAAEKIKQDIDEEGLEARKQELAQVEAAIEKLESKRRTPVYVMYELAMILTDAKEGGGPDVDKEKLRQIVKSDPQAEINTLWDPTGLWLTKVEEKGGLLIIEGGARDATDLSEFTGRLRASARFGRVSHPNFERVDASGKDGDPHLTWKLDVAVRRWD
ncbi:MAG: PilN domain-containing protein, partial [Myxococcales bacterium]|nr:PilN domain-containing protein [Myxococcales bacterium]